MSKLSEMIARLCPNGVEYRKIKDTFKRLRGTPITAGQMKQIQNDDGEIMIFAGGKTAVRAKEKDILRANITRVPAVLVQSRGIIDFIYCDKPFTFKNEMWAYTADDPITVKYLYYVLQNNAKAFREAASGMGALPQISLKVTEDFPIPLPPLPVQREIVQILDNFANLTAELTAELAKRKKQYEHYRDMLLNFTGGGRYDKFGVEWKRLGEIGRVAMCKRVLKQQTMTNGDIPFFKIGTFGKAPDAYISRSLFDELRQSYSYPQKGSVLISAAGTIGRAIIFDGEPAYYQDSNIVWLEHDERQVLNKYLYYFYQTSPWQVSIGGTIPRLYNRNIEETKIPLPPLAEQKRIVAILDRFDSLCNSLTEGLPAEIALRKKQYEYYRDKLLSFKEAS